MFYQIFKSGNSNKIFKWPQLHIDNFIYLLAQGKHGNKFTTQTLAILEAF